MLIRNDETTQTEKLMQSSNVMNSVQKGMYETATGQPRRQQTSTHKSTSSLQQQRLQRQSESIFLLAGACGKVLYLFSQVANSSFKLMQLIDTFHVGHLPAEGGVDFLLALLHLTKFSVHPVQFW